MISFNINIILNSTSHFIEGVNGVNRLATKGENVTDYRQNE